MNTQTIRRAKKDSQHPYKAMPRALFEDSRITFEARGILGYILVKPDDWEVDLTDLMRRGNIGRDQARRIVKELIDAGYLTRHEVRNDLGRFCGYTYLVYEEPQFVEPETPNQHVTDILTRVPETEFPATEKPATGYPATENPPHTKEEVFTNEEVKQSKKKTTPIPPAVVGVVASALEETKASTSKANGAVFELWQNNMPGSLTPLIVEQLNDAINTYGAFEVDNAIRIAVGNGKRNMRYVQGILDKRATGDDRAANNRPMQSSGEFLGENRDSYNRIPSGGKIMQPHEIVWKG